MLDLQYEYRCDNCGHQYQSDEDAHTSGCCDQRAIATDDPNFSVSRPEDYHEYPELENWIIEKLLGAGGQAVAYRVRRAEVTSGEKFVAKVLKPWRPGGKQASAEEHWGRFKREVAALSALSETGCPRIVPIVDAALSDAHGAHWYVMPYYCGGTLHARISAYQGNVDAALRDVGLLAETLAWMHGHDPQYVHRDVHTENVFFGEDDACPILGDFGLVHVRAPVQTAITGDREPFGPWRWRPPELHPGSTDKTQPASDVYLLGGVLYETFTGGESVEETQNADGSFVHERPEFSIRRFTNDSRVDRVERLLRSMLARDPNARISASDVATACRAIRSGELGDSAAAAQDLRAQLRVTASTARERSAMRRREQDQGELFKIIYQIAEAVVERRGLGGREAQPFEFREWIWIAKELVIDGERRDEMIEKRFPGSAHVVIVVDGEFGPEPAYALRSYLWLVRTQERRDLVILERADAMVEVFETFAQDVALLPRLDRAVEAELDHVIAVVEARVSADLDGGSSQ